MKKYFSSAVCSNGILSAYSTIYKNDTSAKVYLINSGDDYERAIFFSQLIKNLSGYNITLFNPFYDDGADGIYVENLNTYILSNGGYSRIMPTLPDIWEKHISIVESQSYPKDLIEEIVMQKAQEKSYYQQACKELKKASIVKERLHNELSPFLNEEKIINFIHRLYKRAFKAYGTNYEGKIRILSSPTPLGIHTHYDTIFHACDRVINIVDETEFISSIILGVVKNYALKGKLSIIASPAYFAKDFWNFLIFPKLRFGICVSDNSKSLPFQADETISAARFFKDTDILSNKKIRTLIDVENKFLDKAVLSLYEGRDIRFKCNNMISGLSDSDEALESANKFAERVLN